MISKFSVKKPFTVIVAIVIVLIVGAVSYTKMTIDLIPSVNLPYAAVVTTYYGASPEQVETNVTATIEQTLSSIDNVKGIMSTSAENMSMVILEFNSDTNMDSSILQMRENLDMITSYFPEEIGSPMIIKINPSMMPIESIAVTIKNMEADEAAVYIEDKIIPDLKSIEGVASVSATGLLENMVDVVISDEKVKTLNEDIKAYYEKKMQDELAASMPALPPGMSIEDAMAAAGQEMPEVDIPDVEITKDMISGILAGQNFSMPTGTILSENGTSHLLRVGDKFKSIEELSTQVLFNIEGYGDVSLEDVTNIHEYNNLESIYSKVNKNNGIMLAMQKQPEFSTAEVTNSIQEKMDEIMGKNSDIEFTILMNQGEYVNVMINTIISNLLWGAGLAVIILLIFLRRIRPTLIVAASIAISLITAFVLMYLAGISLNMISMGGLALAVGMLVDNSIVVIENIFRMRAEGKSNKEAAIEGAKQVAGAITASTITTIVVFVPIVFTEGLTRELFTDMALTIAFSLVASLVVALTLVPAATSAMRVSKSDEKKTFMDKFSEGYAKLLGKSLNHKWIAIVLSIVLLGGSVYAATTSGAELFPTMDTGQLLISVNMPEEYTREETFEAYDELTDIVLSIDKVESVGIMDTSGSASADNALMSMAGSGTPIYVLLDKDREVSTDDISDEIREKTKDLPFEVKASSSSMDMSAVSGSPIDITLYGRELDTLRKTAKDIADIVTDVEGTMDVSDGLGKAEEELRIIVDKEKAIKNGLTVAQVYMAVSEAIADEKVSATLTQDGLDYSIYVKDDREDEVLSEGLEDIELTDREGNTLKVEDVAEIVSAEGFSSISRVDQERVVSITGSLKSGFDVNEVSAQIKEKLDAYEFEDGTRYEISGEAKSIEETFYDLFLMIALAIVFIYLVMVAEFQSFKSPFIVMFTIPLAFTGGFAALFFTGSKISAVSLIGLVVLVGIVVNNGIVFVDYTNQLVEKGMTVKDALVTAGKHRLRPILMTALTTIIAMAAMAIDTSAGGELMKPMAITSLGGLIYSTILTLFLVPAMYGIFFKDKKPKAKSKTKAKA